MQVTKEAVAALKAYFDGLDRLAEVGADIRNRHPNEQDNWPPEDHQRWNDVTDELEVLWTAATDHFDAQDINALSSRIVAEVTRGEWRRRD